MRTLAIGLVLACAAGFVAATPADAAKCFAPKAVAISKTPMSKLPPPQVCVDGRVEEIKGVAYCVSCGLKAIQVAPGKCVAACKSGFVFNDATKQCCPGNAPPPPVIK